MARKTAARSDKVTLQRADIRALHAAVGRLYDHSEFGENFRGGPEASVETIRRLVLKMKIV